MKRSFLDITTEIAETKGDFWLSPEEIDNKLAELYNEISEKENGVYWYYKNLDKTIEMAVDYKKQMDDKIKKMKYAQKRLKELVVESYESTDSVPKHDEFNPIKIMESSAVEVIDELVIPMEYFITVETIKLDKKKVLKDLRDGKEIPGCQLKHNKYVKGLK